MNTTDHGRRVERALEGKRIAIAYDCLFPYTVGGGERWYRRLAEGLAASGAEVTYLTRRQWDGGEPDIAGVKVVAVSSRSQLYDAEGRRLIGPTVRFGAGLFRWMLRHRRDFDSVQLASFPFFSLIGLRLALIGSPTKVIVDWFEVWSKSYWMSYAGPIVGRIGYSIQGLCLRLSPWTVVLSAPNADRLARLGVRRPPLVMAGLLATSTEIPGGALRSAADPPYVFFAGRHITDKGVDLVPEVARLMREKNPDVRFKVAGDGPLRPAVERRCAELGLADSVELLGFVSDDELEELLHRAACVLVPSRREGYGLMVVDAMASGAPVVTAAFPENLAVEHVEATNGRIADPPTSARIAEAISDVLAGGEDLRRTTAHWYAVNAPAKSVDRSVRQLAHLHAQLLASAVPG